MKKFFRAGVFLALCVLLIACGQSTLDPTQQAAFDSVLATTRADYALTLTPQPTSSPQLTPTRLPTPTLLPTIEPDKIDDLLKTAFSIQTLDGADGHVMRQISGWRYGFRHGWRGGYEWLDSKHLLLDPSAGQLYVGEGRRVDDLVPQRVVINLDTGLVWLPRGGVYWSPELGILITSTVLGGHFSEDRDAVITYTADGEDVDIYWGKLLGVSPSRTKILVADDTLIDLTDNRKVDFAWYMDERSSQHFQLYWSSDESRVYWCCYYFGDTRTGEGYRFEMSELNGSGARPSPNSTHVHGQWVRNSDFFLIEWTVLDDGYPDYYPMFDPAAKTYYEVSEMAGIPADWTCAETNVSTDGRYVWIECWEGSYLVNLATFASAAYPGRISNDLEWSTDGNYAWLSFSDNDVPQVLSVSSHELQPIPVKPIAAWQLQWHPADEIIAYISEDKQTLVFLNAQTLSVQEVSLPSTFRELVWSTDGERLALLAEDGSLWQIDYPTLDNLGQLTKAMPDVREVIWSPDGAYLSFISGADIYIVDANVNP